MNTNQSQYEEMVIPVRCEDCRYGYQFYYDHNGIIVRWVECRNPDGLNRDVPNDGYCYCGERREQNVDC